MIAIPTHDSPGTPRNLADCLKTGLPRAFSILFFSPDTRLGWMLIAVSLLIPQIGLTAIAGICAAAGIAYFLGYDPAQIRNGYMLFNPMLVCLVIASINRNYHFTPPVYLALWGAAVIGGFFVATALQQWFGVQFALSAQSIPSVLSAYVLYFVAFAIAGPVTAPVETPSAWMDWNFLPPFWQVFFKTFGAMLFQPRVLPGVLVYIALAMTSPLTTLIASATFMTGAATMNLLGFQAGPEGILWCGYNFLLCGIALGTAYFAPSRGSLLLALAGTFLCALVATALSTALRYFGLSAGALPYNAVVLIFVYALRQRRSASGLYPSPAPGMLPETAGRFVLLNAKRYPHLNLPALRLPVGGEWTITQAVDGELTHRGAWRWAFDFELMWNGHRHEGDGSRLADYFSYDAPVFAPCGGVIITVVSHVQDNAPGMNNPDENWGNHILMLGDNGCTVLLAHLRESSALVGIGQRVVTGEMIARCGNSGRSPVPHLHLQMQYGNQIGAATRPFCLTHYIESTAHSTARVYRTSGIPIQGERMSPITPSPALHEIFSGWLPGEYRYRIQHEQTAWEETVLVDFDELGRFRFRSRRAKAGMTAFLSENVFYATDYEARPGTGNHGSILALFAAGLARVPCIADAGVEWQDCVSFVPFFSGSFRWFHDMIDPFFGPSLLPLRFRMIENSAIFTVETTLDGEANSMPSHAPQKITTTLVPRRGISRIEARLCNDTKITAELIEPALVQPHAEAPSPSLPNTPSPTLLYAVVK